MAAEPFKNTIKVRTSRDAHLSCVLDDPEFQADITTANKKPSEAVYQEIRNKYAITKTELAYLTSGYWKLAVPKSVKNINYITESKEVEITVDIKITEEELLKVFQIIKKIRYDQGEIPKTRKRSIENPELVYAVFKARKRNETYPEIFDQYSIKKLPYYTKSPIFDHYLELKRFYLKNRPDK